MTILNNDLTIQKEQNDFIDILMSSVESGIPYHATKYISYFAKIVNLTDSELNSLNDDEYKKVINVLDDNQCYSLMYTYKCLRLGFFDLAKSFREIDNGIGGEIEFFMAQKQFFDLTNQHKF